VAATVCTPANQASGRAASYILYTLGGCDQPRYEEAAADDVHEAGDEGAVAAGVGPQERRLVQAQGAHGADSIGIVDKGFASRRRCPSGDEFEGYLWFPSV